MNMCITYPHGKEEKQREGGKQSRYKLAGTVGYLRQRTVGFGTQLGFDDAKFFQPASNSQGQILEDMVNYQ